MGHTFKDDRYKEDGGRTQALRLCQTIEEHTAMIEPTSWRTYRHPAHAGVKDMSPATEAILAEGIRRFLDSGR